MQSSADLRADQATTERAKVLVPTAQHIRTLVAARLAADVADVPTLVVARTDALGAKLLTSDIDERDAEAEEVAAAIHERYPGTLLAYNCSPSFNWRRHLNDGQIAAFQRELAGLGYRFQFITLAGFHAVNLSMFELARGYRDEAMPAYVRLQERELELEPEGYTATRHQREVGAGYFDQVLETITGGTASTLALTGSTEATQFTEERSAA